ncbi:HNH endonuclease [Streptomyces sp. DSM 44915]|uniref:HNH endonuclease n=1 Tax=Streptomyces chisholmiae TaxID=3075540 RepID=A0ABU2JUP7_9ACTN|nr:HNH endonuclease [Streptomyces sp. DSM 44915]MDT0268249.1 HNH endonuclease [Streptomyces sp. DSM 44915]
MPIGDITRDAVLKALHEHDELGREAFHAKYGYDLAKSHVLIHERREYDSAAIAGAAHQWSADPGAALSPHEYAKARDHAASQLIGAGFKVKVVKNPAWARDEIILACQLVMSNGWRGLEAHDPRVGDLSALLQLLPIHAEASRNDKFRNANGVARKTFDIATRHPEYTGKPTNGGALDVAVLHEFLARPAEMTQAADLIRQGLSSGSLQALPVADDEELDDYSAPEGRLLLRQHRVRERNPKLRQRKIDSVRAAGGQLCCEACGFDFEEVYGERGAGYIECHHVVPLHVAGERRTRLQDLALICANCHRVIHRKTPWSTPEELRIIVEQRRASGGR